MSRFRYKAASPNGGVIDGTLDAVDKDHVVRQLRALGQIPICVDHETAEKSQPRLLGFARRRRRIGEQRIADMTRELATLLQAGMPLDDALQTLAAVAGDQPLGEVLDDVRRRVKDGSTLSDAMGRHEPFSRFYVNLLRAGEIGGSLEVVLERLADHLDRSIQIKDALKSALIYPAILVAVALASIFILLGHVVPQFTEMFDSAGQVLPLSTRATIAVGEFLQSYGWLLGAVAVLGFAGLRRQLRNEQAAHRWHAVLLRTPLIGLLIMKIEVARFARTMATLLQNGVPLLDALAIVKDTVGNRVLAAGLGRVAAGLKDGHNLADPLRRETPFPPLAVQMIKVGEESGSLPATLERVAGSFERDSSITITRSLALLEPILILVLGAIIAAVIISILVAILGVNDLVV